MDRVRMTLPCYLPGQRGYWQEVHASATITEDGEIHIKLRDPKDAEALVKMALEGTLYQVAFDYKMPADAAKARTDPKEN